MLGFPGLYTLQLLKEGPSVPHEPHKTRRPGKVGARPSTTGSGASGARKRHREALLGPLLAHAAPPPPPPWALQAAGRPGLHMAPSWKHSQGQLLLIPKGPVSASASLPGTY